MSARENRPNARQRMRVDGLCGVMLARILLAPYVCHWTDVDGEMLDSRGQIRKVSSNSGHDVEFELADEAPSLDQLRWLLNQVGDMHVAAQSLNYSRLYTGERMDYRYLDRMQPSDDVTIKLTQTAPVLKAPAASLKSRIDGMGEVLEMYTPTGSLSESEEDGDGPMRYGVLHATSGAPFGAGVSGGAEAADRTRDAVPRAQLVVALPRIDWRR